MEQEKRRLRRRAARWERRLLTALATALSAELFVNVWVDNFRVSGAVVLYPVLLVTLMQDSRKPDTGVLTSCMVLLVRCLLGMLGGAGAAEILLRAPSSTSAMRGCSVWSCGTGRRHLFPSCGGASGYAIPSPTSSTSPCPRARSRT